MRLRSLVLFAFVLGCGAPEPTYRDNAPTPYSVVLVTLDGMRWQELFDGTDPLLTPDPSVVFSRFWSEVAPRGRVWGDPRTGDEVRVATGSNASLPGYMSIYAERAQGCVTNSCGPVGVATFLDRLHDELDVPKEQLEVIASWSKMSLAVTARDDVAVVRAGEFDAKTGGQALTEDSFETDRSPVLAWPDALAKKPRFLHLALLDSDRYAHQGDYDRYVQVLRAYDRLLADLAGRLDENTALVVTTDHGRGLWEQWSEHGPQVPASARVWAYVQLPAACRELSLAEASARRFDHHDVRYTIEALFGLSTTSTSGFSTGFIAAP